MSATVRPAARSDLAAVAELHAEQIGEGFLASLGQGFLELLYRRMLLSPDAFLLVAGDEEVAGFVSGTIRTRSFYREFLRHDAFRAAWAARRRLPAQAWRATETLRYGRRGSDATTEWPDAELLSLAVRPSAQGRGVGRALVGELVAEMRRRDVASARVTVAGDNHRAQHVYTACGFRRATTVEVHRGRLSDVLVWP